MIHQTRNESVKRMFKNFNRTKGKLASVRKKINISGSSKPNIKQEKYEPNKSITSQNNSYMNRNKKK